MQNQRPEELMKPVTFDHRKVAPRVCIVDAKPHIRKFLRESLEGLGFVAAECAQIGELSIALDCQMPDLIVLGFSVGGVEAAAMLEALAAKAFDGAVLLVGARHSLMVTAVQELGEQLRITMLPILATPFDGTSLRNSVATLLPSEPPPTPVIDVGEALNADWLELWYQPKFNADTVELDGVEALIRVRHPTWGVVQPAYFIPDKGDSDLRTLSQFVVNRAIDDWRSFITHRSVVVSINLPTSFFSDPGSISKLLRQLPDHPAFEGLMIEIDAADVIQNFDLTKAAAKQLRFSNIGISIDDVGLEWASLAELRDFPFVEIKVDPQFIAGCADDRLKQKVCRQILNFADGFGARTVAEGVETRADFLTLREMGFDLVQGFLFGKPMTAHKFALTALRYPVTLSP